jgi:predicted dienelactone hydrolase
MNNLINEARYIPINDAKPTVSVTPVTLAAPDRGLDLQLRVTAPVTGGNLPIILLSHGHGPSLYLPSKDGYGPIVNFLAAHGFVVIQPTHLNSKVAGLPSDAPGAPLFWRSRALDMKRILDRLDEIEASTPAIAGRLDRSKIAAVGHSLGGQTVGMLLGARLTDPKNENATDVSMIDPRIIAGVLLAPPGNGGDDLSEVAAKNYSALNPDFSTMTTQALVVAGESDESPHLTVRGADWHADAYHCSPGGKCLLTLSGGKHGLGGIAGYDAKETDDEDADRLAVVQRLTWAYLRSALYADDPAWSKACKALEDHASSQGRVECK